MSPYLRKTIMAALAAVALTGVNSQAHAASICTSDTFCYDVPEPDDPPPPVYEPYDPYPDDSGFDSGNDGGGGSSEPAPEPTPPPACLELQTKGLPEGCSRALANAGTPKPEFQQPAGIELVLHDREWSDLLRAGLDYADQRLAECYADVSIPPSSCEQAYIDTVSSMDNLVYGTPDFSAYMRGVQDLQSRMAVAESNRIWAARLSSDAVSFSFYNISLGSGLLADAMLQDQYNQALIASREQKLCKLWYQVWDGNNCSN